MTGRGDAQWAGEADGLVGRDDALRRLHGSILEGSRVVTVVGPHGAGRSALLEYAGRSATADGWRVVPLAGRSATSGRSFSALRGLLAAAGVAAVDETNPPHELGREVLQRLVRLAEERPVLLLLDDVQWFDHDSLSVLDFVGNRLRGSWISIIAAARDDLPPGSWAGHPRVELPPLTEHEALTLLRRAGLEPAGLIRASLLARAAGSPGSLLELALAAAAEPQVVGLASARLDHGVRMRQRHRPIAARRQLQAAYDAFVRIGAQGWAEVAAAELRAAGALGSDAPSLGWEALSAQEQEVVRLAASGHTNREIATLLRLPAPAVADLLYDAFPKLGVTARFQLRDVAEAR